MARWCEVREASPELVERAEALLAAGRHKTLATLRHDGSPRISGTEAQLRAGDLWFGSMWQARKALDLQRDPRFALHGASVDPPVWSADVKLAGRAVQVHEPAVVAELNAEAPPGPSHLFRADVTELTVVRLGDPADHLVVESWHEGRGLTRVERR